MSDGAKIVTPSCFVDSTETENLEAGELVQLRVKKKPGRPRAQYTPRVAEFDLADRERAAFDRQRAEVGRYDRCLTYAASKGWRGFSCASCRIREDLSDDEQHRDLDGLIMFLYALNLAGG